MLIVPTQEYLCFRVTKLALAYVFAFCGAEMKPRTSCMLSTHSTTELHPQPG
jgi:hypothetical protein